MGKIFIVDDEGKTVPENVQDIVFDILRAALTPGMKDTGDSQLISIMRGIAIDKQLSQKYDKSLSFHRQVPISDIRTLVVVFTYTPESRDCIAQIQIWSSGPDDDDRVFFGIFTIENPDVTQLEIKEMATIGLWLPELRSR